MKKHLLSFIGSICGVVTLLLWEAPFLVYTDPSEHYGNVGDAYPLSTNFGLGNGPYDTDWFFLGFVLMLSAIISLICLFFVIKGVLEDKKYDKVLVPFAIVNGVCALVLYEFIATFADYNYYAIGWGLIFVFILLLASFVLILLDYILKAVKEKKAKI